MRSYTYSQGKWQLCKDTLPPTALRGFQGNTDSWDKFENALTKNGFSPYASEDYTSRVGQIHVFARKHETLSLSRAANEPYDFLCILSIGDSYIRVWIPDLPELLLFFVEIDAKCEDDTLKEFLADRTLQSMISHINILAEYWYDHTPEIEVTVKQSPPPKRSS